VVVGAAAAAHKDVILGGVGYGSYLEGDVVGGDLVALGSELGDSGLEWFGHITQQAVPASVDDATILQYNILLVFYPYLSSCCYSDTVIQSSDTVIQYV